jgi:hypothetical protein
MTETLPLPTRDETVVFDGKVLSALCLAHGHGIESHLTGRLADLTDLLLLVEQQRDDREVRGLDRSCAAIVAVAESIGMRTMVTAAWSVRNAIAWGDDAAMGACTARMLRLGRPQAMRHWTVRRDTVA